MTMLSLIAWIFLVQSQAAPGPQTTAGSSVQAATSPAAAEFPTPRNAKERMDLATKVNGLQGLNVPWHLKAAYQLFGPDGKETEKGTYEEWRVNAQQYRIALQGPTQSKEEYGTDHGTFRTGDHGWLRRPLSSIQRMIERPISLPANPENSALVNYERDFGVGKRPCTALPGTGPDKTPENSTSYCFAPMNAILFYSTTSDGTMETLYQEIALSHGHYFARDLQLFLLGQPWMKVHIDTLEPLSAVGMNALQVPADASLVTAPVALEKITSGRLIKRVEPQYPSEAEQQRVQGTVIVTGVIGKDGHVTQLEILGGPAMFQKAAIDCVRRWVFTPFLLEGKPVDVETDIIVNFRLRP
jgi:TonB family protein